jgi:hypothetical protein
MTGHCGAAGIAQRPFMQRSPDVQQSEEDLQLSNSMEQPVGFVTQTGVLPISPRQKPLQHWSPELQPLPTSRQAGRTQ